MNPIALLLSFLLPSLIDKGVDTYDTFKNTELAGSQLDWEKQKYREEKASRARAEEEITARMREMTVKNVVIMNACLLKTVNMPLGCNSEALPLMRKWHMKIWHLGKV
jgi:hypothetical protein